jgi:HD domain
MSVDDEPPFAAGRPLVVAAFSWAARRHVGQSRAVDDAPFILHPVEVAALLSSGGYDDEVIAAGLLHDVVENTEAGIDDVRARFGDRVARIVASVTEDDAIEDYEQRKAALREQVAAAGPDAHLVYAADKLAKTRELRAQAASGRPRGRGGAGSPPRALRTEPEDARSRGSRPGDRPPARLRAVGHATAPAARAPRMAQPLGDPQRRRLTSGVLGDGRPYVRTRRFWRRSHSP